MRCNTTATAAASGCSMTTRRSRSSCRGEWWIGGRSATRVSARARRGSNHFLTPTVRQLSHAPTAHSYDYSMYPRIAIAIAILLAASPRIASAERVKVAVVPGIAVNLDAARVDALSQDLAEALRSELDIDAVGGLEVRRQLPSAGLPPDCVATPACVGDVANRLGAQQLLFVVMIDTGTGGAIQIDSTWVDPNAHKSASRPAI